MGKLKEIEESLNKPLEKEQLEKIIYNLFCFIIFLMPVIPEKIGMGIYSLKNTIFNMITITTAVSLMLINIKERRHFKINTYDSIVIIYFILVCVSTIFSDYGIIECILGTNGRGEGLLTIFSYLVTFIICTKGYKHINKTYKVGFIGAVIVSIYGIIQANVPIEINLPFGVANEVGVAEGTMGNQNFFSSYLCIFLPMLCYYFLNSKSIGSIISASILFTAFIFAKTLGGYLVFAVMYGGICIFSLIFNDKRKIVLKRIVVLTLVFASIFSLITLLKGDDYAKELSDTSKQITELISKDEHFGTNRLAIWKKVLMAIGNNKLLGVGPDSLCKEFKDKKYRGEDSSDILNRRIVDKAHSEYLHVAVTTGIPSLLVYVVLIAIICIRLLIITVNMNKKDKTNKNKTYITMTLIGIISYLVQAVGNISVVQVAPIFWAILGTGAGITLNEKLDK